MSASRFTRSPSPHARKFVTFRVCGMIQMRNQLRPIPATVRLMPSTRPTPSRPYSASPMAALRRPARNLCPPAQTAAPCPVHPRDQAQNAHRAAHRRVMALQINQGPASDEFEVCPPECLVEHIKLQNAATRSDDGQARAIDRHAISDAKRPANLRRANGQFRRPLARRIFSTTPASSTIPVNMAQTIGTRFWCVEQSLFTSASRTKPGSTVIAFAAPQAIPRRMASAIDSPRPNPTAIPAIIASPEPIGFFAFTRGGLKVVTMRPGVSDAYTLFAPSVITACCGPSLTNLRSARGMADFRWQFTRVAAAIHRD